MSKNFLWRTMSEKIFGEDNVQKFARGGQRPKFVRGGQRPKFVRGGQCPEN